MNHNPDILISHTDIELVRNAGNELEQQLIKLHPNHHFKNCETCKAITNWWTINNR